MGLIQESFSQERIFLDNKNKLDIEYIKLEGAGIRAKIAIISDIHSRFPKELTEIICKNSPDLLLICGDILYGADYLRFRDMCEHIEKVSEKVKVIISLGNHDFRKINGNSLKSCFSTPNIIILDNNYIHINDLFIYGYTKKPEEPLFTPSNLPKNKRKTIFMCHNPMDFVKNPDLKKAGFLLTVSGHCHGGQWRIGNRGVYAPGQGIFPRYTSGFHLDNSLFVSRGITNTVNIPRFNNPSHIAFLEFNI